MEYDADKNTKSTGPCSIPFWKFTGVYLVRDPYLEDHSN